MLDSMREWGQFLLRRAALFLVALFGVSVITFTVTHKIGNPVYLIVGTRYSQETLDNLVRELGLDLPLHEQYLNYASNLLRGDLGISRFTYNPVLEDIGRRLPATLELSTWALAMGVLWAVPAGVLAAMRPAGLLARAADLLARTGVSMPGFWLGLLFIFIFYAELHWFPAPLGRIARSLGPPVTITGWYTLDSLLAGDREAFISSVRHLILPALTLAITTSPSTLQITRKRMQEVLQSDYIRSARAFGLPARTVYRYALRNTLGPVITMIAMTYGYLLSGTVLVEVVFTWPGLGLYAVDAMNKSDYEPIIGVVLLSAGFYLLVYLATDVINALLDPRTRAEG